MVFKIGEHFDPAGKKFRLETSEMGLEWRIERYNQKLNAPAFEYALWMVGMNLTDISCGYIAGADPILIDELLEVYEACATASLAREEWREMTVPLAEDDVVGRRYFGSERLLRPRPQAWLHANLVIFLVQWLRTGILDYDAISEVLSKDVEGRVAIEGANDSLDLLPLSAWPEIIALPKIPLWSGLTGQKRRQDAGDRIALAFAEDPAQLHDPKSPARKRARTYMRGSMSQRWLAPGLGTYAMNWLRTIEWREGQSGLSPREVMLRAYAYMPEVEPPTHIAAEVNQLRKIPI